MPPWCFAQDNELKASGVFSAWLVSSMQAGVRVCSGQAGYFRLRRLCQTFCLCQGRWSSQSVLVRANEQLLAIGHTQLVKNAGQMMPDRDARNAQAIGNVLIGQSFAHEVHDFLFSFREPIRAFELSGRAREQGGKLRLTSQICAAILSVEAQHDLLLRLCKMGDHGNKYGRGLYLKYNAIDS